MNDSKVERYQSNKISNIQLNQLKTQNKNRFKARFYQEKHRHAFIFTEDKFRRYIK